MRVQAPYWHKNRCRVAQGLSLGLEIPLLGISSHDPRGVDRRSAFRRSADSCCDRCPHGANILGTSERDTRETMGWLWRHEPTVSEPVLAQKAASGASGLAAVGIDMPIPFLRMAFPIGYLKCFLQRPPCHWHRGYSTLKGWHRLANGSAHLRSRQGYKLINRPFRCLL